MMDVKKFMTDKGYILFQKLEKQFNVTLSKPTSSTGKYHKRSDGKRNSIKDHSFEMLNAATKLMGMFGVKFKTTDCDLIAIAILIHDILKYGISGNRKYTTYDHDKLIGDRVKKNGCFFSTIFSKEQIVILEEIVRYHSGRWSTDLKKNTVDFFDMKFHKYTYLIHCLDMLSSRNLLR